MHVLQSEMSIFCVRAGCTCVRYDWQLIVPNTHCSLFLTHHLCAYLQAQLENYRSYMDILHIERLLYYRDIPLWCPVLKVWEQLQNNYSRVMQNLTDKNLSYSNVKYTARLH